MLTRRSNTLVLSASNDFQWRRNLYMVNAATGFPSLNPISFVTQVVRASKLSCTKRNRIREKINFQFTCNFSVKHVHVVSPFEISSFYYQMLQIFLMAWHLVVPVKECSLSGYTARFMNNKSARYSSNNTGLSEALTRWPFSIFCNYEGEETSQ